jgi:hypothetical protein
MAPRRRRTSRAHPFLKTSSRRAGVVTRDTSSHPRSPYVSHRDCQSLESSLPVPPPESLQVFASTSSFTHSSSLSNPSASAAARAACGCSASARLQSVMSKWARLPGYSARRVRSRSTARSYSPPRPLCWPARRRIAGSTAPHVKPAVTPDRGAAPRVCPLGPDDLSKTERRIGDVSRVEAAADTSLQALVLEHRS